MMRLQDIGRRDTKWNARRVEPCLYVNDGERVVVHIGGGKTVEATVACAAGYHCRVVADGFDRWVHVEDCARRRAVVVP